MSWLSKILRPSVSQTDFNEAFESIERLKKLTNDLERMGTEKRGNDEQLQQIADTAPVAIWAKDSDNRFVYANKTCCETILRCSKADVLEATDTDFEDNALAEVCNQSADVTKARRKTCRFIEHGMYSGGELWIDVVKSPWFKDGEVVGTVGAAKDITTFVPKDVREEYMEAGHNEIAADIVYTAKDIKELLKK